MSAAKKVAKKILSDSALSKFAPKNATDVGILFTNDRIIHRLNREYRGKDKPTDVLSFVYAGGCSCAAHSRLLGEVIISIDTAKKQAKEYQVNLYQEILRLMIHGLLHLVGYDHERVPKREAERMRSEEQRLYEANLRLARGIIVEKRVRR